VRLQLDSSAFFKRYVQERGSDALHLANALVWGAELFVTSDERQFAAAEAEGMHVRLV